MIFKSKCLRKKINLKKSIDVKFAVPSLLLSNIILWQIGTLQLDAFYLLRICDMTRFLKCFDKRIKKTSDSI